jgi:hypothetical protein
MNFQRRNSLLALFVLVVWTLCGCDAFCTRRTIIPSFRSINTAADGSKTQLRMNSVVFDSFGEAATASSPIATTSSLQVSAATLDPTTILSDVLSGILGTPLILAVPIVAALGVAGLIAFFIVSYASPEVEDD